MIEHIAAAMRETIAEKCPNVAIVTAEDLGIPGHQFVVLDAETGAAVNVDFRVLGFSMTERARLAAQENGTLDAANF